MTGIPGIPLGIPLPSISIFFLSFSLSTSKEVRLSLSLPLFSPSIQFHSILARSDPHEFDVIAEEGGKKNSCPARNGETKGLISRLLMMTSGCQMALICTCIRVAYIRRGVKRKGRREW